MIIAVSLTAEWLATSGAQPSSPKVTHDVEWARRVLGKFYDDPQLSITSDGETWSAHYADGVFLWGLCKNNDVVAVDGAYRVLFPPHYSPDHRYPVDLVGFCFPYVIYRATNTETGSKEWAIISMMDEPASRAVRSVETDKEWIALSSECELSSVVYIACDDFYRLSIAMRDNHK